MCVDLTSVCVCVQTVRHEVSGVRAVHPCPRAGDEGGWLCLSPALLHVHRLRTAPPEGRRVRRQGRAALLSTRLREGVHANAAQSQE